MRIINKLTTVFFSFILALTTYAQVNSDLRPQVKSPEVSKFEQYMNMPVNLVSGTPQISIPIYTINYGGMNLPISLEYDASGVKVESIASSVGQNWSLNVGGVFSRIVKGAPDEGNPYGFPLGGSILLDCNGYYKDYGLTHISPNLNALQAPQYVNLNTISPRYRAFSEFTSDIPKGYSDTQPDLFYFSSPEGGCKFVFNDQRQVVYLENTDFIVKEDFVSNYFRSWTATSPNGIKYKYGSSNGQDLGVNNAIERTCSGLPDEMLYQYNTNTWFLTEISSYTNNEKINIEYTTNNKYTQIINNNPNYNTDVCSYLVPALINGSQCSINEEGSYSQFAENIVPTYSQTTVDSKLISKIKAGLTEINFYYSNRNDLLPLLNEYAKKLDRIEVNLVDQNGNFESCIKKFIFNYSTTISTDILNYPQDNTSNKRLFLNSLIESSCDNSLTKPYTFIYNSTLLPNRLSFAQDKWGFYNGKINNHSLFPPYRFVPNLNLYANRSVDFNFAKAGTLEKIIYPTKGSVNFVYEAHSAFDPNRTENPPTDILYNPEIVGYLVSDLSPSTNNSPSFSDTNTSIGETTFTYANSDEALAISSHLFFPHPMSNIPSCGSYWFGSKAVEVIDQTTNTVIAQLTYTDVASTSPNQTTSKKFLYPDQLVVGRTYKIKVYGWGYYGHCLHNSTYVERHKIVPIYEVGGLRIKQVLHKDSDDSLATQTNYTYFEPNVVVNPIKAKKFYYNYYNSFASLYGIISNTNISYFTDFMTATATANGQINFTQGYYYHLTTGTDPFDVNFKGPQISYGKVIEDDGKGSTIHTFNKYKSYFELNGFSNPSYFPAPPKFQSILAGDKNAIVVKDSLGDVLKSNSYQYNYSVSNTTVYGISGVQMNGVGASPFSTYVIQGQIKTFKNETEINNFNGNSVSTAKEYEYNGNGHNQPTKITTASSSGDVIETKMYYPSDLLSEPFMSDLVTQNRRGSPIKIETLKNDEKLNEQKTTFDKSASTHNLILTKSIYAAKFPNDLPVLPSPINSALERKVTSDFYDSSGNLTQFTQENGIPVTILWGYNKTQPIAKIENASNSQVVTALGVSNLDSLTDINIGDINNLRANSSFVNTLITTYTYIPLVGVSTITDPKGNVITYTYDSLGRLKNVKDNENNILSDNEYHYQPQN